MSRRVNIVPKLDLKLNLSPPKTNHPLEDSSPTRSMSVSPTSQHSSCLSSDGSRPTSPEARPTSPEAASMMLVGCPRCLMYVMLTEEDPRCPKCKSSVLLDVIHDTTTKHQHK